MANRSPRHLNVFTTSCPDMHLLYRFTITDTSADDFDSLESLIIYYIELHVSYIITAYASIA